MKVELPVFNYSIKNSASADSVDIYIDGAIVDAETQEIYKKWYGDDTSVSYKSFRSQILEADVKTYNVIINSGGGLLTDAMAMHDLLVDLQENKGKIVNTIGRGIIASAATFILLAGKSPEMSANSWLMIHTVSGAAWGNLQEIENYAATMRKFNDRAVSFYQGVTGLTTKKLNDMMDAETWMTADEAKEYGFIKSKTGEAKFSNSIKPEQWKFSNCAVLNAYNSFTHSKNDSEMDTTKITAAIETGFTNLLNSLGISNKKDDEAIKNAVTEFQTGIVNAVKESVPDEAAISTLVTNAVTNALTKLGENEALTNAVNTAVTNATKDVVTTDAMNTAITDKLKNVATIEVLNTTKTEIINAVGGKLGNQSQGTITNKTTGARNWQKD